MNLAVIGTGYVGLVTGACFAEMGNNVVCVETDGGKLDVLKAGKVPFYEPGLEQVVAGNLGEGRLSFTHSMKEAVKRSSIFLIAVGTPPSEDGSADISHVLAVARELGGHLTQYALIVTKSTVPVGTAETVRQTVAEELERRGLQVEFDVVSNPEFLKEGSAVADFIRPDRIIVGCDSERARSLMRELYAPFTRNHERVLYMSVRAAEMTKYAANAMLATRISFMNEMAALCDRLGVDVESVRLGIGSDPRIGYSFIYPGCGYGGSCFPKDVRALVHTAREHGLEAGILRAVNHRNEAQKRVLLDKVIGHFGPDLAGRTFALWGLAFKPGTDDMREAPSLVLLEGLLARGARVKAYDPAAREMARKVLPPQWLNEDGVVLVEHQDHALEGADALVLVTEWKSFRNPNFSAMKKALKAPVIFDGRNQYDPERLRRYGFRYFGIGTGEQLPEREDSRNPVP
ncbi:MAG: UDP-glucose/GDP-mannose dehydrogenase family protein [Nitrospirota bacterium]|jgi:UDPglucose 6-dehydrogenase